MQSKFRSAVLITASMVAGAGVGAVVMGRWLEAADQREEMSLRIDYLETLLEAHGIVVDADIGADAEVRDPGLKDPLPKEELQ